MTAIIEAVKAHARANYGVNGWDIVVEAYDDAQIVEDMRGATTAADAIRKVGEVVKMIRDYEDDIRAEAW